MKTLKVGLAMGGGVSLGTFSGAALTESLKLLLLYGRDRDGNLYERVELDCMSGASAGAISLALLLRALIDYKSVQESAGYKTDDNLLKDLKEAYSDATIESLSNEKLEDLKALQVAQKLQEKIWVETLSLDTLFGNKVGGEFDIEKGFGILDRDKIRDLVNENLCSNLVNISQKSIRFLNQERFLFACSLSNLTPVKKPEVFRRFNKITENGNKKSFQYISNLLNSVSSFEHSELRVIDFIFSQNVIEDKPSAKQWLKFYPKDIKVDEKTRSNDEGAPSFNLNEAESWKVLAASAIACGAFPIAFEPLLLKRYQAEFGDSWPAQFKSLIETFDENKYNNKFKSSKIDGNQDLDYKSFNFPYVDGGTFNNEPIKEAFKLSYFNDFHKEENLETERIILFVDPIVRESDPLFNQATYRTISNEMNEGRVKFNKITEVDKAMGVSSSIIGMLTRQGSIKEEHKSDRFIENSNLNYELQQYLCATETSYSDRPELIETAVNKIQSFLKGGMIPAGTRNLYEYLAWLTRKKQKSEDGKAFSLFPILSKISTKSIQNIVEMLPKKQYDLPNVIRELSTSTPLKDEIKSNEILDGLLNEFQRLFLVSLAEVGLGTIGKDIDAIRVGITPHNESKEVISLPGSELFAFGGFADADVRRYSFEYGRLCALKVLKSNEFRDYYEKSRNLNFDTAPAPHIQGEDVDGTEKNIIERVENIKLYQSKMENYSSKLFSGGFETLSKRLRKIIKLSFFKQFLVSAVLLFSSIISIFTNRFFYGLIKYFAKDKLNINKKKIVQSLKPINVRIEIPKTSFLRLNYRLNSDDKKRSLSFNERVKGDKKVIEFQLFMSPKLGSDEDVLYLFNVSEFNLPKVDQNLPNNLSDNEPAYITELSVTNIWNNLGNGLEFKFPIHSLVNDKNNSVFYSLKNLDYHINPRLRISFDKDKSYSFYFEEGTIDFGK